MTPADLGSRLSESRIVDALKRQIEPVLAHLQGQCARLRIEALTDRRAIRRLLQEAGLDEDRIRAVYAEEALAIRAELEASKPTK